MVGAIGLTRVGAIPSRTDMRQDRTDERERDRTDERERDRTDERERDRTDRVSGIAPTISEGSHRP
jgi:hypothetical protein